MRLSKYNINTMKTILLFLAITLCVSCGEDPIIQSSPLCQQIEFDNTFEIKVGETACLPNGRSFKIEEVRDEFCPCLAICIWEGQLVMKISTIDLDGEEAEIEIGSTKNIPHGNIFEDVSVFDFTYLYNDIDDSLPLCTGTYDQEEITLKLNLKEIN